MDEKTKQYFENMGEPTGLETVIGLAVVGLTIFAMKKISDTMNGKKSWREWLTRGL